MDNSGIIFKATNNGLILLMNEELEFDTIYSQIDKKLNSAGKFFKGSTLAVKYRGRKLSVEEIKIIHDLMTNRTQAVIDSFEEDTNIEIPTLSKEVNSEKEEKKEKEEKEQKGEMEQDNRVEEGVTKFYRGTVRSGQLISFDGNVVILGDVNPGAEVQASGNIIVMGSLRGTVHAGMFGDNKAIVASNNLQPVQLRIANIITRPPDGQELKIDIDPEIAFVKDDMIYIERFLIKR